MRDPLRTWTRLLHTCPNPGTSLRILWIQEKAGPLRPYTRLNPLLHNRILLLIYKNGYVYPSIHSLSTPRCSRTYPGIQPGIFRKERHLQVWSLCHYCNNHPLIHFPMDIWGNHIPGQQTAIHFPWVFKRFTCVCFKYLSRRKLNCRI